MAADRPDIIVAVDLGTTYTGVAWARPQKNRVLQSPIQVIHNWPGVASKNEQKVHTCLVYNADNSLSSWGSLCEEEEEEDLAGKQKREFFKIFLDKQTLEMARQAGISQAPQSIAEAQKLVSDFLKHVYLHVKSTVELHTGIGHVGWQNLVVEFIFSVPTTWRTHDIINTFKDTIRTAGFGAEGPYHKATVELTESEAAAVGTVKSSTVGFQAGDVFLCIDAGGGTTDFALMEVVEAREPFPLLSQRSQVDGIGIGSALIDQAFVSYLNSRLSQFPELVSQLPPNCAERLVKSERFRTMKHKFGERVYQSSTYKIPLEGVPFHFSHEAAKIESGRIVLTWDEVQSLFDPHVNSILRKIQEQLNWMQLHGLHRPVSHMILSGGLGSSKYVRDRLQHELREYGHPCAKQVKILQAPDPQLVVVKGLLLDRMQKLDSGSGSTPVIISRIARQSYGLVCKTKYDPNIHLNEVLKKDPFDGQTYAMGQLDWIIKKGDVVNTSEPIISTFTKKIDSQSDNKSWESIVYISDSDADFLPRNINHSGAKQLCTVKSDLTGIADSDLVMKRQGKRFLRKGKKYYICSFEVRAVVAPADLRFELWFGGHKFSGNHEPVKVTWDSEGAQVGS